VRIAIAQVSPVVGDFTGNVRQIREAYEKASDQGADLLLTPELGVCGYPPHDLVERPEIYDRCATAVAELMKLTAGQSCALLVGSIIRSPEKVGRPGQNAVHVLHDGKEVFRQAKTLLPTYDIFDEARYFEPAAQIQVWNHHSGKRIGVAICEDLWAEDSARFGDGKLLYSKNPVDEFRRQGVDLVISISASPYEYGKRERRERIHCGIAKSLGVPLAYVNQVGANDEILFDGSSFVSDSSGSVMARLPLFSEGFQVVEVGQGGATTAGPAVLPEIEVLHQGLVRGIRDYFQRTGFRSAVIGLSGGIDSALIAVLAAEALGAERILGVAMPSQHSSSGSLSDAEALARSLGIRFQVQPIKFQYSTASRELSSAVGGELAPLAQENLQSRLRGVILMTLSNHYRALVLTTGNKSEIATGYCTLYGDMCGALAPIGDLYKTRVYELSRHINDEFVKQGRSAPIPESSITKAPSAELRPDQKDQDTLPPYADLDELLMRYLEGGESIEKLEKDLDSRVKPGWVRDILKMVENQEFKRRQAAPVLKISGKAFGLGRRMPIAKRW
jgi:NAD+ synthase (glutamine-hydrolysing)